MRREYDFSKGRRNPYAAKLKQSVTIRLDQSTVAYFKKLAADTEIPYQTLINLYLRECAGSRRKLSLEWRNPRRGAA
jgi:predicted DNA binding CopG/RHH family protein